MLGEACGAVLGSVYSLESRDSGLMSRQRVQIKWERKTGAEDKNGNGKFYSYFASFFPRLITPIKGLESAPEDPEPYKHACSGPMPDMIHPHDARSHSSSHERLSTPRLKAKQNVGARKHDFSFAAYCRSIGIVFLSLSSQFI